MMLKLYCVPISLYCAKLRFVLRHKQLEWQEVPPPGGYGSAEYKRLVPAGNLPALEHNGLLLADSEAIAEYLNEVFPEPDMLPGTAADRAKIRQLSRFHDTRLEPQLRALFPAIAAEQRDGIQIQLQWSALRERFEQVERLVADAGDRLTLADCGMAITVTWIDCLAPHFDCDPILYPSVERYIQRLCQHAAVAAELAEYRPRLMDWLASR
jgi:glutathione S-transferase